MTIGAALFHVGPLVQLQVAAYTREQLTERASFDLDGATGRSLFREVQALAGPTLEESASKLRERIHRIVGDAATTLMRANGHTLYVVALPVKPMICAKTSGKFLVIVTL